MAFDVETLWGATRASGKRKRYDFGVCPYRVVVKVETVLK